MKPNIRHPEWLRASSPQKAIDLYLDGRIPGQIARWMIVTGLRHPLRAVYGSDLRAALALLWRATAGKSWEEIKFRYWTICNPEEVREMDLDWERVNHGKKES